MLAFTVRGISRFMGLETQGFSWGGHVNKNGARSTWDYLMDWGPSMLIIRKDKTVHLTGAFTVIAEYETTDDSGRVISCKPLFMTKQKGDRVIFGWFRAHRELNKLERAR